MTTSLLIIDDGYGTPTSLTLLGRYRTPPSHPAEFLEEAIDIANAAMKQVGADSLGNFSLYFAGEETFPAGTPLQEDRAYSGLMRAPQTEDPIWYAREIVGDLAYSDIGRAISNITPQDVRIIDFETARLSVPTGHRTA